MRAAHEERSKHWKTQERGHAHVHIQAHGHVHPTHRPVEVCKRVPGQAEALFCIQVQAGQRVLLFHILRRQRQLRLDVLQQPLLLRRCLLLLLLVLLLQER